MDSTADESSRSFEASLRAASKKQQAAVERQRAADDRAMARAHGRDRINPESGASADETAADDDNSKERCPSNAVPVESITDLADRFRQQPIQVEEDPFIEIGGTQPATVSMTLTATIDSAAGLIPQPEAMMGTRDGEGRQAAAIAGDIPQIPSGTDISDLKVNPAGSNEITVKAGLDGTVGSVDAGTVSDEKDAPTAPLKPVGGAENVAAHAVKSIDAQIQLETRPAETAKTGDESRPVSGFEITPQSDVAERFGDPPHRPQHLPTGPGVSDPQNRASTIRPAEAASAARSGELSTVQQGGGRMPGDCQQAREGDGKSDPVAGDDSTAKLAKLYPASKDSAFMHHQEQNFERLLEPATPMREKAATLDAWRAQTLDQIVNRVVYQSKNGQNEVRIDLKPEFLGQVRMQIVTENQQVSVRIVAELPLVKEMLENNLQQLKADLQQQGLEVDEIAVSVSTDSQHGAQDRNLKTDPSSPTEPAANGETDVDLQPAAAIAAARPSNRAVDMFA